MRAIIFRDRIEHETLAFLVREDPAFAAHAFGHENSAHARRPNHSGRMKLYELHVDQFRARFVSERMAIAGILPTVARNLVGAADTARREHDCFRAKNFESTALALVTECAHNTIAIF